VNPILSFSSRARQEAMDSLDEIITLPNKNPEAVKEAIFFLTDPHHFHPISPDLRPSITHLFNVIQRPECFVKPKENPADLKIFVLEKLAEKIRSLILGRLPVRQKDIVFLLK